MFDRAPGSPVAAIGIWPRARWLLTGCSNGLVLPAAVNIRIPDEGRLRVPVGLRCREQNDSGINVSLKDGLEESKAPWAFYNIQ